jgi:glutaredoxin
LEKEYRELGVNYKDVFTVEVPKRKKEIRENFFHSPFIFLPGKEIFRLLKQKIHTLYGIKISEIEVARAFKKTEVPEEIKQALLFLK